MQHVAWVCCGSCFGVMICAHLLLCWRIMCFSFTPSCGRWVYASPSCSEAMSGRAVWRRSMLTESLQTCFGPYRQVASSIRVNRANHPPGEAAPPDSRVKRLFHQMLRKNSIALNHMPLQTRHQPGFSCSPSGKCQLNKRGSQGAHSMGPTNYRRM